MESPYKEPSVLATPPGVPATPPIYLKIKMNDSSLTLHTKADNVVSYDLSEEKKN